MSEAPKCPYCGDKMTLHFVLHGFDRPIISAWYQCVTCDSTSPRIEFPASYATNKIEGKMLDVTLHRAKSESWEERCPNRILEWQEVIAMAEAEKQEVVFVQWRDDYDDYARPNLTENGYIYFELLGEGKSAMFKAEDYNREFRCWPRMPTNEENGKAPKWEGEGSNG